TRARAPSSGDSGSPASSSIPPARSAVPSTSRASRSRMRSPSATAWPRWAAATMASDAMKPAATFDPTRPRRLHPLTLVFETIRIGRHLVLPSLAGVASTANDGFARTLTVGLGILAVPALIAAIARFVGFRYHLTGEELILDSGVFSRRRRIIPLARIQNVDVSEKPLERLCGVASLLIETAGGKKTEGVLSVLSRADADALRAILLERRAGAASTDDAPPVETLVRLSTRELVVAGATANEIGLV